MVLVRLCVECADLSLAKSIVERGVDLIWGDIQTGRGCTINIEVHADPVGLLICGDVTHFWEFSQLHHHLRRPRVQFGDVGIFEGVLVLGAAHAVVHC